jgi:hypothetical protein
MFHGGLRGNQTPEHGLSVAPRYLHPVAIISCCQLNSALLYKLHITKGHIVNQNNDNDITPEDGWAVDPDTGKEFLEFDAQPVIEQVFNSVAAEIDRGDIAFVNMGGRVAGSAIGHVHSTINNKFREFDTVSGGRGALYMTMRVFMALHAVNKASLFSLRVGVFAKRRGGSRVHTWLEYKRSSGAIVVNVSKLSTQPVYSMTKKQYLEINRRTATVASMSSDQFMDKLGKFLIKNGATDMSTDPAVEAFCAYALPKAIRKISNIER